MYKRQGMTTDQVQISVGKAAQVYARNDKMFLTEDVKVKAVYKRQVQSRLFQQVLPQEA